MAITPVFLLSLPRSGSTFTQRVIAAHDGISTASEPWILLPLLDILRRPMPMQTAYHAEVSTGVEDFLEELPGGEDEYLGEVRSLALGLYERAADPGARFFLDKTVRYFLIAELLVRTFPDARFVVLWRNPLSVISSMVESLGSGRWVMARHRLELFHGVDDLVSLVRRHGDRVHSVRYEDLLTGEAPWKELMSYIGADFDSTSLARFTEVDLRGRKGDKVGSRRYAHLSLEPLEKRRRTLINPVRVAWCRRYLHWVGRERLETMGYDLDLLLGELDEIGTGRQNVGRDCLDLGHAAAREIWRARMQGNRLVSSWRALAAAGNGASPAMAETASRAHDAEAGEA